MGSTRHCPSPADAERGAYHDEVIDAVGRGDMRAAVEHAHAERDATFRLIDTYERMRGRR